MTYLLITTSRKPSQRTRSFVKDLANSLPDTIRLNRGKKTLLELSLECYRYGANYLFIVSERKGNPSLIKIYSLDKSRQYPLLKQTALLKLSGIKLSRESHSTRIYNPEYIWVNYDKCITSNCYYIADLLIDIFKDRISSEKYHVLINLEEVNSIINFKMFNQLGRECGPLIKISGVKVF